MQMASDTMRSIGQRYGLTPGDRATLAVDPNLPKSGATRLLDGGSRRGP